MTWPETIGVVLILWACFFVGFAVATGDSPRKWFRS